jgi:hypothetical protein
LPKALSKRRRQGQKPPIKFPASGKGRTVALSTAGYRAKRGEEFLKLGARPSKDDVVAALPDGSLMAPLITHAPIRWPGVHPKIARERLGHSKIGITPDLHSHVIPGMQEDAPETVDAALKYATEMQDGSKRGSRRIGGPDAE